MNSTSPPRAAYVHVPFCRHRCGYCNFTVVAGRNDLVDDYLKAIEIELSWLDQSQQVDTLFVGGGTPTHLSPDRLRSFLSLLNRWFPGSEQLEFSIEANPEDIDQQVVEVLAESGVNRVSLGVQSFDDAKLMRLERSHRHDTVARSVELLRPAVRSISFDLIFGAPDESVATWEGDLTRAMALLPDHVSTYGLTIEKGTQFFGRQQRAELASLGEDVERVMYERAIDRLEGCDYEHYEVSNFARPGKRCRHNENYWKCGEYFAVGPGASRFVKGRRETNHRSTTRYLQCVLAGESPVSEVETLSEVDRAHEVLVFGLRRLDGVSRHEFRLRTGFELEDIAGADLAWLVEQGWLRFQRDSLQLTRSGLLVSDAIWPYLL